MKYVFVSTSGIREIVQERWAGFLVCLLFLRCVFSPDSLSSVNFQHLCTAGRDKCCAMAPATQLTSAETARAQGLSPEMQTEPRLLPGTGLSSPSAALSGPAEMRPFLFYCPPGTTTPCGMCCALSGL